MYQHEDRIKVMSEIENFTRSINGIQGLLLVGSGSTGFRDQYSDLDLLVVVENPENVVDINEQIRGFLQSRFCVLKEKVYQHEKDIFVTCFFFENYLELDLGVWSFNKLRATKPDWIVVFDREGTLSDKLNDSLNKLIHRDVDEAINDSLSFIWQFFRSAVVALKRGHFIKALKDIDFIRNQIIELICLRNNINYDFDKSIDQIDSYHVSNLKNTYKVKMDYTSIKKVLFDVMNIYFDVMDIKENDVVEKNRRMIHKFLEDELI